MMKAFEERKHFFRTLFYTLLIIHLPIEFSYAKGVELEKRKDEIAQLVDEYQKKGLYIHPSMETAVNRFYTDMDLLVWEGLTHEETSIRLEESLQALVSSPENSFFQTLYRQYLVIIKLLPEESWPSTVRQAER